MTTTFNSPLDIDSEALRAAQIIESVIGNAWAADVAGKFIYVTPAALSHLGITLEDLNSHPEGGAYGWKRIIHPDDYDGAVAAWRRCLETGEHYDLELRTVRASGAYGWSRSSGQPLRGRQGHIVGWYGTLIDRDVPSAAGKRFIELAGAAPEENAAAEGPHALHLIHPDDRTVAAEAAARAFWTGVPQVTRHRQLQSDGTYRWTETRSEPGYSVNVDIDELVTEREPSPMTASHPTGGGEAEVIRSVQAIESIFGNGWAFDAAGRWIYLHPFAQNSLGVTLEDLNASLKEGYTAWKRLLHPDDYERVAATWLHCLETGDHFNVEFRFRRATGLYTWARTAARPVRDGQGRIAGWFGIALDNDVYKKTVAALRDREQELSQLVDMVPSHIWRLAPDGEPTFFNKRMVDFLGLDVADMARPGMRRLEALIETVHPEDAQDFRVALDRCLVTGESFVMRYRLRRVDGVYRWMSSRAEPTRDQEGRIVQWYGLCHDVDDQVHAEEALRRSERKLQQLTDAVPALIWATTPEGTPSYVNKRFRDVTGATLEDITAPDRSPSLSVIHPEDVDRARHAINHSFRTGAPYAQRYRQLRSDGSYRWTETRAEPLRDDAGVILQWYGVSVDIHDLVTAQEALRDREREFSQLVDMVPIQIARHSSDGQPIFFNKRAKDFFGFDLADREKPGMSRLAAAIESAVHPDDVASLTEQFNHCLATGMPFFNRHRLRRADGVYRWTEARAEPVRDKAGQIVQWYAATVDIDDEVSAQQALRNRERELSQLVDIVPSLLWRLSPEGEPTFLSKRLINFLGPGIADADKPGMGRLAAIIEGAVHPDDAAGLREALNRSFVTGERFSKKYRLRRADGVYRWVEGSAEPLRDESGHIVQWYGLSHDIDDQVRAEEALRNSKQQLEQMIEAVPFSFLSFAPSGKMTYASKRYLEQAGPPAADIEDFDALARDVAHPEDFPAMFRRARNGFATGQPFVNRFRRRLKNGDYRWIEARAQPLRDADGAIVQWYIASIDIEDEMRAQEALRARERFLWQLVEMLPAMIDCAAPDGEPIYRSHQLREFLGYDLEELDGTGKSRLAGTLDAGVHPDDIAAFKEQYAQSLATGQPYARKHRLRRFDGEYRWVETRAAPMRDTEGTIVQWNLICLDIDGEVRAQEELRQARERLARASQAASLAELSASIAHEVNQPLAAVVANSHACHRWLSAEPPNLERAKITAERIIRDANSAADVVSRIRALFKQSTETRTSTTLDSLIGEARDLVAEDAVRRSVRVNVDVESNLPPVALDRVQIQQVLINLIRNGMEAMDSAGGDKVLGIRVSRMGGAVQVEITDRGGGIEFPDRIFEPFFTTKQHGMGMGLAICRSIVEAHGGRLWAEKNEPHGTKLAFTLPGDVKAEPDAG